MVVRLVGCSEIRIQRLVDQSVRSFKSIRSFRKFRPLSEASRVKRTPLRIAASSSVIREGHFPGSWGDQKCCLAQPTHDGHFPGSWGHQKCCLAQPTHGRLDLTNWRMEPSGDKARIILASSKLARQRAS